MALLQSLNIPHEIEPQAALNWFQRSIFTDIPPHFLTHWKTDKLFFYGGDGLLAFEETPKSLVVAGEPVMAAHTGDEELWRSFRQLAERRGKAVLGYGFGEQWSSSEFRKKPIGTNLRIDLNTFDLQSPDAREVRRALRKGQQLDYNVIPVSLKQREGHQGLEQLIQRWKQSKPPVRFKYFLSKPNPNHMVSSYEEWFMVEHKGETLAFCSLLPYLIDGELGFYLDHLIHDPQRHPHALSFLISFLIEVLQEEGVTELNLGMNPFANIEGQGFWSWFLRQLYRFPYGYRPRGLHHFKRKFGGFEEPQYCLVPTGRSSLAGLVQLARIGFSPLSSDSRGDS